MTLNKGEFIPFLDHFNLLIHEGGHGIFRIFGKFIYTLGGSLMQIILPTLFIIYSVSARKRIGLQLSVIWLGQNLMNISVYVADARAQLLPLLGGNRVYHDWNWLLTNMDLLNQDQSIGNIIYYLGFICYLLAVICPLFFTDQQEIKKDIILDINLLPLVNPLLKSSHTQR